jgi:hypothetical protein
MAEMAANAGGEDPKPAEVDLAAAFAFVEGRTGVYVDRLREAVAIKSVSAWADHRPEVLRMINWTKVRGDSRGERR